MSTSLGEKDKGEVGNTAVPVNATVIDESGVSSGIPVIGRVVKRRVVHEAKSLTSKVAVMSDHPTSVCLTTIDETNSRDTHCIGPSLVKGAAITKVTKICGALNDGVSEFVANDACVSSKVGECDTITITIDHLLAIPEGIVVVFVIVDGGDHVAALSVPRVAVEGLEIKVIADSGVVVGLVDGCIRGDVATLLADECSREFLCVVCCKDGSILGGVDVGEFGDLFATEDRGKDLCVSRLSVHLVGDVCPVCEVSLFFDQKGKRGSRRS